MASALLTVANLSKSYGSLRAVDDVSFQVEAGQTLGLIGPNGAGKSTTVAMLCGLLRSDAGSVRLDGDTVGAGRNAAKARIGLVPQDLALYDDLSARENLKLFGALYGLRGTALAARCDAVLALVSLTDRAADKPAIFSGGMKRRLNIAAALLHEPALLVLDEPTVGVDPQSRNAIFDTLEQLKAQGCALIYTSHYMEEVARLAERIVIIDHGKVLVDATPASLYARLPGQAALAVELGAAPGEALLTAIRALPGVTSADVGIGIGAGADAAAGASTYRLDLLLAHRDDAVPVLVWLAAQGIDVLHFGTEKPRLEDIFLDLTGRSLRDQEPA
jgi:ABC-2 type transport system ATP-binding protein